MGRNRGTADRCSVILKLLIIIIFVLCLAGSASAESLRTGRSLYTEKDVTLVNPGIQVVPVEHVSWIPCPSGYTCMEEAQAREMYGTDVYPANVNTPCGINRENDKAMYCYRPKFSVTGDRNQRVKEILVNNSSGVRSVPGAEPEVIDIIQPYFKPEHQENIPVRTVSDGVTGQSISQNNGEPVKVFSACEGNGMTFCGNGCADLKNDPANCGKCNHVCSKDEGCFSGSCINRVDTYDDKLNSVGDDAQLANIVLQNSLQKQQQMVMMISNISKMISDTAMAVIRKIG